MYEDEFRDDATIYTAEEWYNNYPDDNIPILVDENKYLHKVLKPTGIPAITLLDENLKGISCTICCKNCMVINFLKIRILYKNLN